MVGRRICGLVAALWFVLIVPDSEIMAQNSPETVDLQDPDPWLLWGGQTTLRGANIFQRRVYLELDGTNFMGSGAVGPPYSQADFDRLAAMGANYVNISHPGLFSEKPPYQLAVEMQSNLDQLLTMAAVADLFSVISFRTGPGRSEFTFYWGEDDDWFDASYYNDEVWREQAAQDAWVAMWRHTAARYKDNPVVVGYDLMVEPNSNEVWFDEWDPEEFYSSYGGTLYDWNQLYPRIISGIRDVDTRTPIIAGCMAYSAVEWLPFMVPTTDERTVYSVHQYAPFAYTHQDESENNTYPGVFDLDWDGQPDTFDVTWLTELHQTVDDFVTTHSVRVAANEFGVQRWAPDGARFMSDQMQQFEDRDMNYALWAWEPSWAPWAEEVHAFNFRFGPDPQNVTDVASSDLLDAIQNKWSRNTIRPSTFVGSCDAPAILGQPQSQTANAGESVTLAVTATGTAPLQYQWYQGSSGDDSQPLSGTQGSTFTTPALVQTTSYWVEVTNTCGSAQSDTATVTITSSGPWWLHLVPAVAHNPGAANTLWLTDIGVLNQSGSTATLVVNFNSNSGTNPGEVTLSLADNTHVEWANVQESMFSVDPASDDSGSLVIAATEPLIITSRTYNQTANGTFGQFMPAIVSGAALSDGEIGYLPQIKGNLSFRTNIGVISAGTTPTAVRIRLFDSSGNRIGSDLTMNVAAGNWLQQYDVFSAAGAGDQDLAFATVEVETGSAWAYASVIDRLTGDPTTVPLQRNSER
ncbi:MAG: cellulase family glycosylhydrolase [Thermoanaerobaculales bacterium]|nr:cellulase family glycosylhydrolase [Thermoanaerobaculales bacterium]